MLGMEDAVKKAMYELTKTTGRALMGDAPHDFMGIRYVPIIDEKTGEPERDPEGNIKYKVKGASMHEVNKSAFTRAFRNQPAPRIVEHTQSRMGIYAMGD